MKTLCRLVVVLLFIGSVSAQAGRELTKQILQSSAQTFTLAGQWDFTGKFLLPKSITPPAADCDEAGEAGRLYWDSDAATGVHLYGCEGVSGWVLQGGSGTFLPLAGGTMTGTITTKGASGSAIVIPASGSSSLHAAIEFQSQGTNPTANWYIENSSLSGGAGSENHPLRHAYNFHDGNRITANERWWTFDLESNAGGQLEWNINVDPNLGPAGPVGVFNTIWFYYHSYSKQQTSLAVGPLPYDNPAGGAWQANDPNDFFMAMNRSGAYGFVFGGRNGADISARAKFVDMSKAVTIDPNRGDPYDIQSQGGIVIDPGGDFNLSDRSMYIANISGHFDFEPGVQPDGVTLNRIYFGLYRDTAQVVFGGAPSGTSKVSFDGASDVIQMTVQGHSTQTSSLMVLENSAGTDQLTVSNTGDVAASGQIIASNRGVEFLESDTNPTCAAGNYGVAADLSEAKVKVCNNGTRADLPGWLQGSATLDFVSTLTQTCSADLTIPVTGSVDGMPCLLGPIAASVSASSQFTCWVSVAGTVTVRHCCNGAAATCDPLSGVFRAAVLAP